MPAKQAEGQPVPTSLAAPPCATLSARHDNPPRKQDSLDQGTSLLISLIGCNAVAWTRHHSTIITRA
ncbi:hypothetical protein VTK26DRAFT_8572 [Humicola hyalothermophila]